MIRDSATALRSHSPFLNFPFFNYFQGKINASVLRHLPSDREAQRIELRIKTLRMTFFYAMTLQCSCNWERHNVLNYKSNIQSLL